MKCSDKWLREQIKQVIKNSQPIENNYDVQQLANNILGLLDEREAEVREWIKAHTRRRPDGSIFGEHPCVKIAKEFSGIDE